MVLGVREVLPEVSAAVDDGGAAKSLLERWKVVEVTSDELDTLI